MPAAAQKAAPTSGQALATLKQDLPFPTTLDGAVDPATTTVLDPAEAAVATNEAEEAANLANDAKEAIDNALDTDGTKECSDDFEKTLCEIVEAAEGENAILE